jgi:hypothetical protein
MLQWKVNCVDEAIIMGYKIDYCQLVEGDNSKCIDKPDPIYITPVRDEEIHQFEVDSLKIFKRYNFSIALMAVHHVGFARGPITARTLEAGKLIHVFTVNHKLTNNLFRPQPQQRPAT